MRCAKGWRQWHLCRRGGGGRGPPPTPPLLPPPALRRLRGWDDVDAEIEEIREEDQAEKAAGFISVLKLFRMRSLRWQVISTIILMGGQQLSGVNAVPGQPRAGGAAGRRRGCPERGQGQPGRPHQPRGVCLPDLLLRRPDLPERWGERPGCAVCDCGHGRCQRADDRHRRECPRS